MAQLFLKHTGFLARLCLFLFGLQDSCYLKNEVVVTKVPCVLGEEEQVFHGINTTPISPGIQQRSWNADEDWEDQDPILFIYAKVWKRTAARPGWTVISFVDQESRMITK